VRAGQEAEPGAGGRAARAGAAVRGGPVRREGRRQRYIGMSATPGKNKINKRDVRRHCRPTADRRQDIYNCSRPPLNRTTGGSLIRASDTREPTIINRR
jgi:hypothetical protein